MTPEPNGAEAERSVRRAQVDGHPKPRLSARHTTGGVLLTDRLALIERMPRDAVVAEIGVAFGDFSAEILGCTRPRRLHLIDAWGNARYASGADKVRARSAREIETGQVQINRGLSTEVLGTFDPGYFDWVYIDTNHSYGTTAAELALCDHIVANHGLIAGHDFCTGNIVTPVVYGVIPAVNEFCVANGWRYEALTLESHGHFSFCLRKLDPAGD